MDYISRLYRHEWVKLPTKLSMVFENFNWVRNTDKDETSEFWDFPVYIPIKRV